MKTFTSSVRNYLDTNENVYTWRSGILFCLPIAKCKKINDAQCRTKVKKEDAAGR